MLMINFKKKKSVNLLDHLEIELSIAQASDKFGGDYGGYQG